MRLTMIAALCCLLCSCFYVPPAQDNDTLYGRWYSLIYPEWEMDITPSTITWLHNSEKYATSVIPADLVGAEITLPKGYWNQDSSSGSFTHPRKGKLDFNTIAATTDSTVAVYIPFNPLTITFIKK